jgi:putative CocE/NonD family hydrolase
LRRHGSTVFDDTIHDPVVLCGVVRFATILSTSMRSAFLLLALPGLLPAQPAATPATETAAKQLEYTRAHYTKYDYRIPMRDGVKLFTTVYVPKDMSLTYPIMMTRTPYSVAPYGIDNYRGILGPSDLFTKESFIFVYQDVRGRNLSEGVFVDVPVPRTQFNSPKDSDESTDTYETIDWLVKNIPGNNGRVGIWGISYPGMYAAYSLIGSHPALKAVSPQAPMGDVGNGDDSYHNGAFFLAANFGFYSGFKPRGPDPARPERTLAFDYGTADQYNFYLRMGPISNANEKYLKSQNIYWNDNLLHDIYDEFWQSRALAPHMKNTTPAIMFVGGWFDAEDLAGPLKLFRAVQSNNPQAPETLVMGPWSHGGWSRGDGTTLGNLDFASQTGAFYREHVELPFFLQNLKKKGDGLKASADAKVPEAYVFETGTNQWERFEAWPPKNAVTTPLYFDATGKLSWSAPKTAGFDEYVSDPDKPVPVIGEVGPGMPGDYMTYDQRFASRRPDVLVYQTDPLDHDVTIAGGITPTLHVSTSGTDSDFVVKLIDVYPDDYPDPAPNPKNLHMGGYQQLVRGEPFRGKFRNSLSQPEPFTPGKAAKIEYLMPDVCHTFRPGHRIMVQIQSSWFPLTDRNPQQFMTIPQAKASDFHKATERVYWGGNEASQIRLQILQ